jgi:uncharacterized protein YcbK (DUF882 family)/LysM repeat protein
VRANAVVEAARSHLRWPGTLRSRADHDARTSNARAFARFLVDADRMPNVACDRSFDLGAELRYFWAAMAVVSCLMPASRRVAVVAVALAALAMPAGAAAQRQHTVRAGQSMAQIARRHHVDVWDLALASGLRPTAMLRPGQTLTVPAPHSTYVRPGQTLSEIARANDCTVEEIMSLNRLRRGATLRVGRRLILPGYEAPEAATPREWGPPAAPGTVALRRREEVVTVALVDGERRVTRAGVEALARLMRRHDEDAPELPHPRLALLLAAISDHFGGREITIVSGRREAGGYTRESSRHTEGRATDIRVRGVSMRALWDYCRTLADTGCGYYPRSTFVHVDVRQQAAQWVDWSSPGRRARYGNLSRAWPRMCRQASRRGHRLCRREGRRVTAAADVPLEPLLAADAVALFPAVPAAGDDVAAEIDEYETAIDDDEAEAEEEAAAPADALGG